MEAKIYRYFVSFSADNGQPGLGLGNAEVHLDRPITNGNDIKDVTRILAADGSLTKVTVLYYRLFDEEPNGDLSD